MYIQRSILHTSLFTTILWNDGGVIIGMIMNYR